MDLNVCRLCLRKDDLIDVFYSRKTCAGLNHLRSCILLSTGVHILPEDNITKFVCRVCCNLCLRLFEYRKIAIANEKALKHLRQYVTSNFPVDTDKVTALNEVPLKNPNLTLQKKPNVNSTHSTKSDKQDYVHPTVQNILKAYKTINLPKEALKLNLNPKVLLDKNWKCSNSKEQRDNPMCNTENINNLQSSSETVGSSPSPDSDTSSSNLLQVTKKVAYLVRKPRRKRRKCIRKSEMKNKRYKEDGGQLPHLSDKFLSLSLDDIADKEYADDKKKEEVLAYEMFFSPNELTFLKDVLSRYKDDPQSKELGSVDRSSGMDYVIEPINDTFVVTDLFSCCSAYRIPVVYEHSEATSYQVSIIKNKKKKKLISPIELWRTFD